MATRDELKAAFPSLGPGWDAAIDAGIDVSLILENLDLSPTARVQLLESLLAESQALRASVQFRLEAPRAVFGPDAERIVRFRELLRDWPTRSSTSSSSAASPRPFTGSPSRPAISTSASD